MDQSRCSCGRFGEAPCIACVATAKARFYRDKLADEHDFDEGAWADFIATVVPIDEREVVG